MGNEQSSALSDEAREAEERAVEAHRAAINADLDQRKEEAKKRILAGMAEQAATLTATAPDNSTPTDLSTQSDLAIQADSHNSNLRSPANRTPDHIANKRTVEVESESEEDRTPAPARKRAKKARQREPPPALYKAIVKELADSGIKVTGSTADIDNDMMSRIKKCLARANHPNTPETEAKRALYLASRLMAQYNISRAEVLAHSPPEVQRQYSGESIVSITRVDGDETKQVCQGAFVEKVGRAIEMFFVCEYYSTAISRRNQPPRIEFTFDGIAENTVAAAMAFEMTYNLISEWARSYKGVGGKNSYSVGVGDELYKMAKEARKAEEEEARRMERQEADALKDRVRQEEAERQAQVDRLTALPSGTASEDLATASGNVIAGSNILDNRTVASGRSTDSIWLHSDSESDNESDVGGDMSGLDSALAIDHDDDEDVYVPNFKIEDQEGDVGDGLNEQVDELLNGEAQSSNQALRSDEQPCVNADVSEVDPAQTAGSSTAFSDQILRQSDKTSNGETGSDVQWSSHTQLAKFHKTAKSVSEEHRKKKGVKVYSGRKRDIVIRDWSAYDKGKKDGRKIDVHRRTIKE